MMFRFLAQFTACDSSDRFKKFKRYCRIAGYDYDLKKKFLETLCVADEPDDEEDFGVDMHGFMVALKNLEEFQKCVTRARAREKPSRPLPASQVRQGRVGQGLQERHGDPGEVLRRDPRRLPEQLRHRPVQREHRGLAQGSKIPNFKGSDLGHFPLVSADFWTSDHLLERSRSVDAFPGMRARGTLTLKRR